MKRILIISFLSFFTLMTNGQFAVYNLMELQVGNVSESSEEKMFTIYDQFNASYRLGRFKFSGRFEQFHSSAENEYTYFQVSQINASFRKKRFALQIGNFYDMLGRGLLLRGYDIKGAILEDKIYKSRQGFYRDLLGANILYKGKNVGIKAIYALPSNNQLPITHSDRRLDKVAVIDGYLKLFRQKVGVGFMQHRLIDNIRNFSDFRLQGNLFRFLDYYMELVGEFDENFIPHWYSNNLATGMYASVNFNVQNVGLNLEWKDYRNLAIGSGISDPPTLVKEHSYRLLNRSTHITDLYDERGYQLDAFYPINKSNLITLNHSWAQNLFHQPFNFIEIFAEWMLTKDHWNLRTFVDYSKDGLTLEKSRWAFGSYFSFITSPEWVFDLESEFQQILRIGEGNNPFYNTYLGAGLTFKSKLNLGFVWETTGDPYVSDLAITESIEHFQSFNLSYKWSERNQFMLFAGNRRGGPACTSGVCYDVPDFNGIELRWILTI